MTKIAALPVEAAPALTRYFPETDGATTRRMTLNQVLQLFQTNGMAFSGNLSTSGTFSATGGGTLTGTFKPVANDGATLGDSTHGFADYFGALGHVFKFNNADTITHAAGGWTASGDWTVQGAFTSKGIDDNATGERVEIADTITKFGVAGATYTLTHVAADQIFVIDGGNTGSNGANLRLSGGTTTTVGLDYGFYSGSTLAYYWDQSANTHTFYNNAGSAVNILHSATNVFLADSRFGQNTSNAPGVGNATAGVCLTTSISYFSSSGQALAINHTSSGNMVGFYLAGANQGFISGAGTTITYGAFMGSHIGQMYGSVADTELLRGSIVQTVDEMSFWIGFEYKDHDGNSVFNETDKFPDGLKIGDTFDYTYDVSESKQFTHQDKVRRQVIEQVDEPVTEYELNDSGGAVAVQRSRRIAKPVFDDVPLFDADGKPVMIDVHLLDTEGKPQMVARPVLTKRGKKPVFDTDADGKRVVRTELVPVIEKRQQVVRLPRMETVTIERTETVQEVTQRTVTATVVSMPNDTLVKWTLTTEAGCERPYGVIAWKDNDGSDDWLISGLGAFVCRIKAGVIVKGGDLIQSSDVRGCGEPITEEMNLSALQIIKRHVATVGANIPQQIYYGGPLYYPDQSFIVPATIHAG